MLKKQYRLKKYSAYKATYKLKNIYSDNFVCIYLGKKKDNTDLSTKFGFVVSKKIHKRAVVRNRAKRLMRENIRLMLKNNEIPDINKYLSVIFVAKQQAIQSNYIGINNSLKSLLYNIINS